MFFPVIELIDRYTIAKIKADKGLSVTEELAWYTNQLLQYDTTNVKDLVDELEQIHLGIWALESAIRQGFDDQLGYEEIGRRAVKIRNLNNRRVALKNNIAEKLGCSIREIKKNHLSQ